MFKSNPVKDKEVIPPKQEQRGKKWRIAIIE